MLGHVALFDARKAGAPAVRREVRSSESGAGDLECHQSGRAILLPYAAGLIAFWSQRLGCLEVGG